MDKNNRCWWATCTPAVRPNGPHERTGCEGLVERDEEERDVSLELWAINFGYIEG